MSTKGKCRCHSQKSYASCCQKFHTQEKIPENAEQLMRSRYCAYALGLVDYIINTSHISKRRADLDKWKKEIEHFSQSVDFFDLQILDFEDGEDTAYVTFKAGLKHDGDDVSFTEKSRFIKEDGRWYYVDGAVIRDPNSGFTS